MGDFFGTRMIGADFRQGRINVWARNRLKILVKMRVSWWAHALSNSPGTPPWPAAFLGFIPMGTV